MNIALIIAGGKGVRMGNIIPKQFIMVNDKPVIAYTLEVFQRHPSIDVIAVVCIDGWLLGSGVSSNGREISSFSFHEH